MDECKGCAGELEILENYYFPSTPDCFPWRDKPWIPSEYDGPYCCEECRDYHSGGKAMRISHGEGTCDKCNKTMSEWVHVQLFISPLFNKVISPKEMAVCIGCIRSTSFLYADEQGTVKVNTPIDNRTSTLLEEVKEGIL